VPQQEAAEDAARRALAMFPHVGAIRMNAVGFIDERGVLHWERSYQVGYVTRTGFVPLGSGASWDAAFVAAQPIATAQAARCGPAPARVRLVLMPKAQRTTTTTTTEEEEAT
jgi:hypothetical protein